MSSLLEGFPKFGTGIGLHRVQWFLERLDAARCDAIKITGSNGKGSVATMLGAIFSHLPLRCGVFTSPHLHHESERIVVDGERISDAELSEARDWLLEQDAERRREHPDDRLGAFEAWTILAMFHFLRRDVDVIVAEAGIGGRYDSTRAVPGRVAALTSLDLEHTELLGGTLEEIAYGKADLCENGGTLIVGEIPAEILRRLRIYSRLRGFEILRADPSTIGEVGMHGAHQRSNAAVAALCARSWLERSDLGVMPNLLEDAIRRGLAEARMPGRIEKLSDDPEIYIDVAHTPEAIRAAVETLTAALADHRIVLIVGVSETKKVEEICARLADFADTAICTQPAMGAAVERIESALRSARSELSVRSIPSVPEAIDAALAEARREASAAVFLGSLYLAAEVRNNFSQKEKR